MRRDQERQPTASLPMAPTFGWRHTLSLVLFAIGSVEIFWCLSYAARDIDFSHYYITANILHSGADPYSEPLQPHCAAHGLVYDPRIPVGTHPPLIIKLFACFCWLPLEKAYLVWVVGQAIALATALIVARRIVRASKSPGGNLAFAGFAFASTAMLAHWQYSQVQLLVGALIYVAYFAHTKQRDNVACGLATLAACFKLYPVVLLPWFVFCDAANWRQVLRRLGSALAVALATIAVTGFDAWYGFVTHGLPVIQSAGTSLSNYSLQEVVRRCLESWCSAAAPAALEWLPSFVATGLAATAFLAAYVGVSTRRWDNLVGFSLLITLMVLFSPVAWAHYLVLMILPVAVLLSRRNRFQSRLAQLACSAVAIMCLMPNIDLVLLPSSGSPWRIAVHVYPTYCLVAAAFFLVALRSREPEPVPSPRSSSASPAIGLAPAGS